MLHNACILAIALIAPAAAMAVSCPDAPEPLPSWWDGCAAPDLRGTTLGIFSSEDNERLGQAVVGEWIAFDPFEFVDVYGLAASWSVDGYTFVSSGDLYLWSRGLRGFAFMEGAAPSTDGSITYLGIQRVQLYQIPGLDGYGLDGGDLFYAGGYTVGPDDVVVPSEVTVAFVSEPWSVGLLGLGIAGLALARSRRSKGMIDQTTWS
jgi:hypothetical protein